MRLEATNKNVRGGLNKPPPLPGRVKNIQMAGEVGLFGHKVLPPFGGHFDSFPYTL